jgi:hypothetical protein
MCILPDRGLPQNTRKPSELSESSRLLPGFRGGIFGFASNPRGDPDRVGDQPTCTPVSQKPARQNSDERLPAYAPNLNPVGNRSMRERSLPTLRFAPKPRDPP